LPRISKPTNEDIVLIASLVRVIIFIHIPPFTVFQSALGDMSEHFTDWDGTSSPWSPGGFKEKASSKSIFSLEFLSLVVDEAHELRNTKTNNFRSVIGLRSRSLHCVISTATPVSNDASVGGDKGL
jgi:hypothetical protein